MNSIKCLAFLLFVATASGAVRERRVSKEPRLLDPWREVRDMCRKRCDLTEEQLRKDGNKNLQSVRTYLVCLASELGSLNKDGSLNREMHLKNVALVNPLVIAKPIMDCCLDRVYKGRKPNPHEVAPMLADFATCWKDLLPNSMWDVIGMLEPPVYRRLDKCRNC